MMSSQFFLLTAFGKDRPGIVAEVTRVLFELGGNIEDASMTRLGGEFAMTLIVRLPTNVKEPSFQKSLAALKKKLRLELSAKSMSARLVQGPQRSEAQALISVYGTDQPGIVYRVAQALADRHINITDLQTKVIERSGKPVYVMLLEVACPPAINLEEVKAELNRLKESLGVEITLQDIEPVLL